MNSTITNLSGGISGAIQNVALRNECGGKPLFFRSGSSNIKDIMACIEARVPAGISVAISSANALGKVGQYLRDGGKVLVDSGAFSAFRRGEQIGEANYERHLAVCEDLARTARSRGLYVISPDVVGDQGATLELIRKYADRLKGLSATGAVIIIPLQKGSLSIVEFYRVAQEIMAPCEFCAGLPSRAAALGADEVIGFITAARPAMVHFLGAARARRFQGLLSDVMTLTPRTIFSYDATVLRAISCENAQTPERIHESALEALDGGEIDSTEISPNLSADPLAQQAAAELLSLTVDELKVRLADEDDETSELLSAVWPHFAVRYAELRTKDEWRVRTLVSHPSFNTDPINTQSVMSFG